MNDWLALVPSLMVGILLGGLHYGGLWLTVQRLAGSSHPALLAGGSLAGRLVVTLLGICLVTGGDWIKIGVCLLGLFVARTVLVLHWRPQSDMVAEEGRTHGA
jgi:F1F0 ATPase subunit 2